MQDDNTLHPGSANDNVSKLETLLPQRKESHLSLRDTSDLIAREATGSVYSTNVTRPPTSGLVMHTDTARAQQWATTTTQPAKYTLDDVACKAPGAAGYYKSWAFRKKVLEGRTLTSVHESKPDEDLHDGVDQDCKERSKQTSRRKCLVMIFGFAGVRRATAQRTVDGRMQRANRRLKLLRKLEGAPSLFGRD